MRGELGSELILAIGSQIGLLTKVMLIREVLSEESLCLTQVLDWNFLRDQSGESVHDRSITDLIVILAVCTIPFVAIDLQDRLHEELGPYLIVVGGPWEDWLALLAARDPIINLYQSLFPHESELDPIFSSG